MRLLFAGTLFVSSALLFLVQPLLARMVLPLLGGAPAVWTTCTVCCPAALRAGYARALAAPAWRGVRRHAALQVALLLGVAADAEPGGGGVGVGVAGQQGGLEE